MAEATSKSGDRTINYLARLLQMNPVQQADEIIRARNRALRRDVGPAAASGDAAQVRDRRRKLLEQIEEIRSAFWTMPPAELAAALNRVDVSTAPDVEAAVARLRVVAQERAKLPALSEMAGFDGDFFSKLKHVLIDSPRDVSVLKEQILSSFRNGKHRRRLRQMVRLLEQEVPAIYALEADWFRALYRQRVLARSIFISNSTRSNSSANESSGSKWWIWIAVFILFRFVLSLINDR
jgi:hypothetical protein